MRFGVVSDRKAVTQCNVGCARKKCAEHCMCLDQILAIGGTPEHKPVEQKNGGRNYLQNAFKRNQPFRLAINGGSPKPKNWCQNHEFEEFGG